MQGGSNFSGKFSNAGTAVMGNNFHLPAVHAYFTRSAGDDRLELLVDQCKRSLFLTNPVDDRKTLQRAKPRLLVESCAWILDDPAFKHATEFHTESQLLWISGGPGMGKTMMAIFILRELEMRPRFARDSTTLYYFVDKRDERRNTGVAILRGLIHQLLVKDSDFIQFVLPDFNLRLETLFGPAGMEALWRIFRTMLRSLPEKTAYCVIDGLDECTVDSLEPLLQQIASVVEDENDLQQQLASKGFPPREATAVKIILLSRDEPACLPDCLSQLPRVQLGKITEIRPVNPSGKYRGLSRSRQREEMTSSLLPERAKRPESEDGSIKSTRGSSEVIDNRPPPANQQAPTQMDVLIVPSTAEEPSDGDVKIEALIAMNYEFDNDSDEHSVQSDRTDGSVLSQDDVGINNALRLYIKARIDDIFYRGQLSDTLQTTILHELQMRGDGSFLWVDLALEELRYSEVEHFEEVLGTLPASIGLMYCRILANVPQRQVLSVASMLQLVVVAQRPLSVAELASCLTMMGHNSSNVAQLIRERSKRYGSLICIDQKDKVSVAHASVVDQKDKVSVAHASVIDLLTEKEGLLQSPELSCFHINVSEVHNLFTNLCIRYLQEGCLDKGPITDERSMQQQLRKFPFIEYATTFWPEHFRLAVKPDMDLHTAFFKEGAKLRKRWWQTYYRQGTNANVLTTRKNFTILHLAAYFNLTFLAQKLREDGRLKPRLNKRDSHGETALELAIQCGNFELFCFLLHQGADQKDRLGFPVLFHICHHGHDHMLKYLLGMGYDVITRHDSPVKGIRNTGKALGKMIRWAPSTMEAHRDDSALPGFFWSDIHGDCTTALQVASKQGRVSIVKFLLTEGAEVDALSTKGSTALHYAAYEGQTQCVEVLLSSKADVSSTTVLGWTPLHCAAFRGRVLTVQCLVEAGAMVNSLNYLKQSALHLAAWHGHSSTVRFLVGSGAAVNTRSSSGQTPLHFATLNQSPETVETLLTLGADKMVTDLGGKTAWSVAETDELRRLLHADTPVDAPRPRRDFGDTGEARTHMRAAHRTGSNAAVSHDPGASSPSVSGPPEDDHSSRSQRSPSDVELHPKSPWPPFPTVYSVPTSASASMETLVQEDQQQSSTSGKIPYEAPVVPLGENILQNPKTPPPLPRRPSSTAGSATSSAVTRVQSAPSAPVESRRVSSSTTASQDRFHRLPPSPLPPPPLPPRRKSAKE